MGVKISAATPAASVAGTELIPVSQTGTPRSVTVNQVKDYAIDQIEAIAAGTTAPLTDKAYILQGGVLKPVNLSVIAQNVIDQVWGKADQAAPAGANKLPLIDGSTEKTVTLTGLAAYIRATIEATILDVSGLATADALLDANMLLVTQGTTGKKITFATLYAKIEADVLSAIEGIPYGSTFGTGDYVYILTGGDMKPVPADTASQRALDIMWGKAANAAPADAGKLPLVQSGTEATLTLSVLAAYILTKIRTDMLNISSGLDESTALGGTSLMLVSDAGVSKKATVNAVADVVLGIAFDGTAETSPANTDLLLLETATGEKVVSLTTLATYIKTAIEGDLLNLSALGSATTLGTEDLFLIRQGGTNKKLLPAVISQKTIDQVWGKADQATPADANKLPLKDGSTEKTVTLTGLATYIQTKIRAAVIAASTLDAAGGMTSTDLFIVDQGAGGKKVALSVIYDAIYAGLNAYVVALTAVDTAADTDVFYTIQGGVQKKVTLLKIKTAIGGGVTPPATTTPTRVPQWGASQHALVDGLDVRETIRAQTDALHTAIATEKATRDMIQGMTAVLGRTASATEATQSVTLRGDCQIAVVDSNGVALAERALLRVWISDTDQGAPDATDNTVAIETGTTIQAITANAQYMILTSGTGTAEIRVTLTGAASRYVMVAWGNRVTSAHLDIAVIA